MQRLTALEFFRIFLDTANICRSLKKSELYGRYILLSILAKVQKLLQGLLRMDCPQMWIGSSL
jgi:hypothetical protein